MISQIRHQMEREKNVLTELANAYLLFSVYTTLLSKYMKQEFAFMNIYQEVAIMYVLCNI